MAFDTNALCETVWAYLKDSKQYNFLLEDVEHSKNTIINAIKLSIMEFNATPPFLSLKLTLDNFTDETILYVLDGIIYRLYEGEAVRQERNNLPYNDGGTVINDNARFNPYMQMAAQKKADYLRIVNAVKSETAYAAGWGHISSPYSIINVLGSYGAYVII